MRMTQSGFFGRLTGESAATGTSFPNMVKIGCAYGIPSIRIDCASQLDQVDRALAADGPALIDRGSRSQSGIRAAIQGEAVTGWKDRLTHTRGHVPIPG